MILSELLKKNNILLKTKAKTKWELLDELINRIIDDHDIEYDDSALLKKYLFERECSMSTGIGNGVAIPHCATTRLKQTLIVLAISQKGIDFDSIDNQPVNFIILLLVPKDKLTHHIKTLANIAKLFSNEELRSKLIVSRTPEMVIQTIKKFESKQ